MRPTTWWFVGLVLMLGGSVPAFASEKRPLPDVVVHGTDGTRPSLPSLVPSGPALLIFVHPGSATAARLVAALQGWQAEVPQLETRAVLVFGGTVDQTRRFIDIRGAEMPPVRWVMDADGAAAAALRLAATPAIVGVLDGRIEWVLAGVLNDPATVEPVVTAWVRR